MSVTATPDAAPYGREFLSTTPPARGERLLAAAIMVVSLAGFLAMAPFARRHLPHVPAFIPAYESALVICDLLTAVLIAWQLTQVRSKPLLILAAAYLFDAVVIVPHVLSFPGAFSPTGLLGAGEQTAPWLFIFWHAGFPLFIIVYAWLDHRRGTPVTLRDSLVQPLLGAVVFVFLLVLGLSLLTTVGEPLLPPLVTGDDFTGAVANGVTPAVWLMSLAAFLLLRPWHPRSVLNLWLGVVMFAWLLDVGATSILGATRFDIGFYGGRAYGLLAATFVLIMLLLELGRLYHRLSGTREVEDRARVLGQVVAAQEGERQRIARELHDEMGSYLTGMKVRLDLLSRKYGSSAVQELETLLSQMDHAVDGVAIELRPPTLDDMGIDRAVAQLGERFTHATGIPVHLHERNGGVRLPDTVETTLYRVVQEALTNVWKHSGAQTVSIILERRADEVRLIIEDNGRGFDTAVLARHDAASRFGLLGMQERVRLVNGTLTVESAPGSGTTLYVRVPLMPPEVTP